ncbi:MAG TPA: hypothetical protein VJI46_07215 [Candidatus Nanoarchaeia archaeon]|nr:hypothetical protein [Candidatus Nanoarchaeia archaeon]
MDIDILRRGVAYRTKKVLAGIKSALLGRLRLNILILILIIGISLYAGYLIKGDNEMPTGLVTLSEALENCPKCSCPSVEPEIIEKECAKPEPAEPGSAETIIYYQCASGVLVNDTEYCRVMPNITTPDYGYTDGFTLAIDGITFIVEDQEQELYRIKWINYTLTNEGEHDIVPLIEVRVYDEWNSRVASQYPQKVIGTNDVLTGNEYIRSSAVSNIIFKKLPKTVRLALKNKMDDNGEGILAVTTTLE